MTNTATTQQPSTPNKTTQDQLRSYIERLERLLEEKKSISEDIKEVFGEAKGNGYNPKVMKKIIQIRAANPSETEELEAILDIYKQALGMI